MFLAGSVETRSCQCYLSHPDSDQVHRRQMVPLSSQEYLAEWHQNLSNRQTE